MFESNRACPGCSSQDYRVIAELPARSFCAANSTYRIEWAEILGISQDAEFPLCRCADCGFVFAGWCPPTDFLNRVYDRVIDADQGRLESTRASWIAHQARILAAVLDEVERRWGLLSHGLRALDVGCSYGNQLRILRVAGFEVLGVDASPRVQKHLEAVGVPHVRTLEEAAEKGPFDVVLLNEVLEHLPDFRSALRLTAGALRDRGLVWISVPDFSDWRLRDALREMHRGGRPTRELNPWEHLNYFTPRALRRAAIEAGLRPLDRSHAIDLGRDDRPGWKTPARAIGVARAGARWWLRGAPTRTDLLAERT